MDNWQSRILVGRRGEDELAGGSAGGGAGVVFGPAVGEGCEEWASYGAIAGELLCED